VKQVAAVGLTFSITPNRSQWGTGQAREFMLSISWSKQDSHEMVLCAWMQRLSPVLETRVQTKHAVEKVI